MREMTIFYKQHIEECKELARHASDRDDRAFWNQAAQRWAAILQQYEKPAAAKIVDSCANTRRVTAAKKQPRRQSALIYDGSAPSS
jgi:hypothetical protein